MNVYEAAIKRIEFIFQEFEQIVVSFSGGKDSGVMLNLVLDYAKKSNQLDKIFCYHIDYEAFDFFRCLLYRIYTWYERSRFCNWYWKYSLYDLLNS